MISFEFVSRRLVSLDTHRCEGIHCCTSEKQNKDQLQLAKSILPSRSSRLVSPKPPPFSPSPVRTHGSGGNLVITLPPVAFK